MLTYLCLTHSPLLAFLFFTPFCPVPHCLLLYFAIWFTFLCFYFVLMKSIWLAFILSRDVFVSTRIKTRVVFPWPPLLTPNEGPSLETSIFSCIVSGSERTFTFRVYFSYEVFPFMDSCNISIGMWQIFLKAVNSFFLGITWVLGCLGITPVLKENKSLKSLNFITIKYSQQIHKKKCLGYPKKCLL